MTQELLNAFHYISGKTFTLLVKFNINSIEVKVLDVMSLFYTFALDPLLLADCVLEFLCG